MCEVFAFLSAWCVCALCVHAMNDLMYDALGSSPWIR